MESYAFDFENYAMVHIIIEYPLKFSCPFFNYNYIGTAHNTEIRERLQQQTLMMSTDIRKFKPYEDGTFYLVYTQDGLITKGYLPDGFPNQSNLSLGQVGEIQANGMTFYYYDVPINAPNYRGIFACHYEPKNHRSKW